jgi:DNA-binding response OmpR family regulator
MKKILVADQEESLCLLYQKELIEEGYEVVSVTRPEDLIQAVGQENPDLVLMDTAMDEQREWSLLQGMRKSGYRLPIILFTTYCASKGFPEALADDTVMKSSHLDELKLKIGKMLGNGGELVFPNTTLIESREEKRSQEQMRFSFQD